MALKVVYSSSYSSATAWVYYPNSQPLFLRRKYHYRSDGAGWFWHPKASQNLCPVLRQKDFSWGQSLLATFTDQSHSIESISHDMEGVSKSADSQDEFEPGSASIHSYGKPGLISFYNCPYRMNDKPINKVERKGSSLLWFIGPSVLVSSFILPSLYLRKMLTTVFEDSLLTDFLILFFTEALFYSGVGIFLFLIDRLTTSLEPHGNISDIGVEAPQVAQRISSVATLVLSLTIPMVTMGLVWPWTGPAASATLAPYLVGIVVQFAFEQCARYRKSPSWPVIPAIFQVYRLHQLNRAAQLVTALSYTVKGAEMTSHNLAISSSLGTLLNVLQLLGVLCIWSLSSLLLKFPPYATWTSR